jgi:hypothetical protein
MDCKCEKIEAIKRQIDDIEFDIGKFDEERISLIHKRQASFDALTKIVLQLQVGDNGGQNAAIISDIARTYTIDVENVENAVIAQNEKVYAYRELERDLERLENK